MAASLWFILAVAGVPASAYLLAKRAGPIVPFVFIAAYVLAVGAITFIDVVVFDRVDVKFRQPPVSALLDVYCPLVTVLYLPCVVSFSLACWFSCRSTWRDA